MKPRFFSFTIIAFFAQANAVAANIIQCSYQRSEIKDSYGTESFEQSKNKRNDKIYIKVGKAGQKPTFFQFADDLDRMEREENHCDPENHSIGGPFFGLISGDVDKSSVYCRVGAYEARISAKDQDNKDAFARLVLNRTNGELEVSYGSTDLSNGLAFFDFYSCRRLEAPRF